MGGMGLTDIADGVYPGRCSEKDCRREIDGKEWFWFVDAGGAKLSFCQNCGAPDGEWEYVTRATAVELVDDRTGEAFDRAIDINSFWEPKGSDNGP